MDGLRKIDGLTAWAICLAAYCLTASAAQASLLLPTSPLTFTEADLAAAVESATSGQSSQPDAPARDPADQQSPEPTELQFAFVIGSTTSTSTTSTSTGGHTNVRANGAALAVDPAVNLNDFRPTGWLAGERRLSIPPGPVSFLLRPPEC